jgi:hypothetical protein
MKPYKNLPKVKEILEKTTKKLTPSFVKRDKPRNNGTKNLPQCVPKENITNNLWATSFSSCKRWTDWPIKNKNKSCSGGKKS